jgi:NNMT/PNMT/TEMT family
MSDHESSVPNEAAPWSDFNAEVYWQDNYKFVFPEDAQIIRQAAHFMIEACAGRPAVPRAVDVGAGANLYPALLMLPWAEHIVFTEFASANIAWLNANLTDSPGEWRWQPFWDLLADLPGYRDIAQPRQRLAARREIRALSIFDLPAYAWDLGSMFFVADGMTTDEAEFEHAVGSFIGALKPGAPFMMAFMESSAGYAVSGIKFPAVKVTPQSLAELLTGMPVTGIDVLRTDKSARPLRPGYDAMLLVTGHVTVGKPARRG